MLSYGLYLWHWPLYLVVNSSSTGLDGAPLVALRLAATAAAAVASYHLVEMPVRERAAGGRLPALRLAGAMPITLVVVLVAALSSNALIDRPATERVHRRRPGRHLRGAAADGAGGRVAAPGADVAAEPVEPAEPPVRALMVGDSVAATLGFGFGSVNLDPGLLEGLRRPEPRPRRP